MTRQIAVLFLLVVACWLGYMAWLTGYRLGYEDGAAGAWEQVNRAVPAYRAGGRESENTVADILATDDGSL